MKHHKIYFNDRMDAAKELFSILPSEKMKKENWIILSTSAGGFPIAYSLSHLLGSGLDFLFNTKIFAPNNDECEIAIVTETKEVVIHEELVRAFDINLDFIFSNANRLYDDILLKQVYRYRSGKSLSDFKGKNVLLVDEGLNTSLTIMACIKTAIHLEAKSVSVAVPILPKASVRIIESIADDLYFCNVIEHFIVIDSYYKKLDPISYEENLIMMKENNVNRI